MYTGSENEKEKIYSTLSFYVLHMYVSDTVIPEIFFVFYKI